MLLDEQELPTLQELKNVGFMRRRQFGGKMILSMCFAHLKPLA
jgi:hypothetical protein